MKRKVMVLLPLMLLALTLRAAAFGGDVDVGGGGGGGGFSGGGGGNYYGEETSWRDTGTLAGALATLLVGLLVAGCAIVPGVHQSIHSRQTRKANRAAALFELRREDPHFDEEQVTAQVREWVRRFEDAWCAGDMSPEHQVIGESLALRYRDQLQLLAQQGRAWRSEDLQVLDCQVQGYRQEKGLELLDVWIREQKRVWVVDVREDRVVEGKPETVYRLEYLWQLSRPAAGGRPRPAGEEFGAPNGWVLHHVEKLSQVDRSGKRRKERAKID